MYGGSGVAPAARRRAAGASAPRRDARAARPARSACPAFNRRVGRASPSHTSPSMRSSSSTSPRGDSIGIRAGTTFVSLTTTSSPCELVRQLGEAAMAHGTGRALVDEQPRLVAPRGRMLRDQLRRQLVVQLRDIHPTATVTSPTMDADAIARAQARHSRGRRRPRRARAGRRRLRARARPGRGARRRCGRARVDAAAHASATPSRTASAPQVLPVARHLAEVRGLMNQLLRRLERVEGDLLAERHARVDDLALLVDLVSSGWRGRRSAARPHRGENRRAAARRNRVPDREHRRAEQLGPGTQTGYASAGSGLGRRRQHELEAAAEPGLAADVDASRRAPPRARARSRARDRCRRRRATRTAGRSARVLRR